MAYVEYDSNNSGGSWWLSDDDWKALEKASWVVEWANLTPVYNKAGNHELDERGVPKLTPNEDGLFVRSGDDGVPRFLGALAKRAFKPNCSDIRAAADEWERITGQSATDAGCPCCGQPHTFTAYDDNDKPIDSGPNTSYEASW